MAYKNFNSSDVAFLKAVRDCSPNVVKFLTGLASGNEEAGIDYDFLNVLGCRQYDGKGDYFRVVQVAQQDGSIQSPGLRTYDEQCQTYAVGRNVESTVLSYQGVTVPKILRGGWSKLVKSDRKSGSYVVTNAWGGDSYHNYGLAVDICLRHFGDAVPESLVMTVGGVKYDSLEKIYRRCGLLAWAKKCHLEWGGTWTDFPDVVHFQDTDYRPIPDRVYFGCFNLRNRANCSFQTCKDYWAGKFDADLEKFSSALSGKSDTDITSGSEKVPTFSEGGLKVAGGLGVLLLLGGLAYWLHKRG